MDGDLSSTTRPTRRNVRPERPDRHRVGHAAPGVRRRSSRGTGIRGRVVAATAATLVAVGGGAAVAPSASAQDPVTSSQDVSAFLSEGVQSSYGTFLTIGAPVILPLYFVVWCPIAITLGSVDPDSGTCTF